MKTDTILNADIQAIDLFSGAGGLSHGLKMAGVDVRVGVDLDPACKFAFEKNNGAAFLLKSVEEITARELFGFLNKPKFVLLAGCAPCQPFSKYRQGKCDESDGRWHLLRSFQRLALNMAPDFVTMENVPRLAEQQVFHDFKVSLEDAGYHVWAEVVNCLRHGVPQGRERLVMMASKHGKVSLLLPSRNVRKTVRQVIGKLPKLQAGKASASDPIHQSAGLTPLNYARIVASRPGGTWRDWPAELVAVCHQKKSGKTYPSVYGRMEWDKPSPTITTQFYGFGNGRFGHPSQNRALSLREGALLQSFPKSYQFVEPGRAIEFSKIGRLIGNAVPVKLAESIGRSFVAHVEALQTLRQLA
ncbi:MAG: DNA cytosine methyltransferase [Verrucomicrobiaceae bacterium]|nr:DNA cytosine methyltransferase [Verrucomicrobiaceae bacterium]